MGRRRHAPVSRCGPCRCGAFDAERHGCVGRSVSVDHQTAEEEAAGKQQARGAQAVRGRAAGIDARRLGRHGEGDVHQRQQRAVRVRQRQHQPARRVAHVEVPADLEAVQRLQHDAERQEEQQAPPAEPQMRPRVPARSIWLQVFIVSTIPNYWWNMGKCRR